MFGSQFLDIALGMIFVYLSLSLTCSAINEWIAGLSRSRARHLEAWVRELLAPKAPAQPSASSGAAGSPRTAPSSDTCVPAPGRLRTSNTGSTSIRSTSSTVSAASNPCCSCRPDTSACATESGSGSATARRRRCGGSSGSERCFALGNDTHFSVVITPLKMTLQVPVD